MSEEIKSIKIGGQEWMAGNLALTKDRDGNDLILGTDYWYPNGDAANVNEYGLLYTWEAAIRTVPTGWHLPTDGEWAALEEYCGEHYAFGDDKRNIAKSLAATKGWDENLREFLISKGFDYEEYAIGMNQSENNATGFGALPAGLYSNSSYGYFGTFAHYWSANPIGKSLARSIYLTAEAATMSHLMIGRKDNGISVRCIKD